MVILFVFTNPCFCFFEVIVKACGQLPASCYSSLLKIFNETETYQKSEPVEPPTSRHFCFSSAKMFLLTVPPIFDPLIDNVGSIWSSAFKFLSGAGNLRDVSSDSPSKSCSAPSFCWRWWWADENCDFQRLNFLTSYLF